jgi:hypothetical protein
MVKAAQNAFQIEATAQAGATATQVSTASTLNKTTKASLPETSVQEGRLKNLGEGINTTSILSYPFGGLSQTRKEIPKNNVVFARYPG